MQLPITRQEKEFEKLCKILVMFLSDMSERDRQTILNKTITLYSKRRETK